APRAVTAGCGVTNVAVVEFSVCQTMKNVSFKQNLRAPIGQVPTTRCLDAQYSPYLRAAYTECICDSCHPIARQRYRGTLKCKCRHAYLLRLHLTQCFATTTPRKELPSKHEHFYAFVHMVISAL